MTHTAVLEQRTFPDFTTVDAIEGYTKVAYKRNLDPAWYWPLEEADMAAILELVDQGVLSFVHQRVGPGTYNLLCFRVHA